MAVVTDGATETLHVVATRGGPLGVAVVDPMVADRGTFVVAMGYGASIEKFELQRFRLLATELGARLIVVETPGCGMPGSGLTAAERWSLLARSSFARVAGRMLDAALAVVPDLLGARGDASEAATLGVVGYSLGASTGTAIAAEVRRRSLVPVDSLVLVEPVAGQRWKPARLIAATREEDGLVDHALAANKSIPGVIEPWDRRDDGLPAPKRREVDLALLANALRTGRLPGQVAASGAPRVLIVRGRSSRLSSEGACTAIANAARQAGARADEYVSEGSHGLWHSLPSVQRLGRFVRSALTEEG